MMVIMITITIIIIITVKTILATLDRKSRKRFNNEGNVPPAKRR